MVISTLSMSENNGDSPANLMNTGYVDALDLIVSTIFFSHERRNLVPYLYQKLDKDDRFQLAAASTHCKLCLMETRRVKNRMHGSANLRSSSNIEHICIGRARSSRILQFRGSGNSFDKYKTIRKSVRYETLRRRFRQSPKEEKAGKGRSRQRPSAG